MSGEVSANFAMQNYSIRRGTINFGYEYEHLIPALIALRAICRADVVDMWLASNAEGMGAFDDVIFCVQFQDGQKKAYAIQLKHKSCPITATSFTVQGSDDYNIEKYQKSYEEVVRNIKAEKNSFLEGIAIEDISFLIYTTSNVSPTIDKETMRNLNLALDTHEVQQNVFSLLNTSSNNNCVYTFHTDDISKTSYDATFLTQFYLYVSQAPTFSVEILLQQIINQEFTNVDANFMLNFLRFIRMWIRGDLGGHYILQKDELQLKVTELLLNSHLIVPKTIRQFKQVNLWNEVVKTREITVMENYTDKDLTLLWGFVNSILYTYTDRKLKENCPWETSIEIKFSGLPKKYKKSDLFTLTLKQVGLDRELTMKSLYIVLWKAGLLPLLVKADDSAELKNIFAALKSSSGQTVQRYVILLIKNEGSSFNTYYEQESILQSLADVKNGKLIQSVLENLQISLQGRKTIHLSNILNEDCDIFKGITTQMIFRMLDEPLTIGKKYEDLPEIYIKRTVTRIILDQEVLKEPGHIFIINGPGDIVAEMEARTDTWRVIDGSNYFESISNRETMGNVVALRDSQKLNREERAHLCSKSKHVHYLRYVDDGNLQLLNSVGCIDDVRKYIRDDKIMISEDNIFDYFSHNISIIRADPGMGKSIMIKYLAKTCIEDYWVESIVLNNHHRFFKQHSHPDLSTFSDTNATDSNAPSVYNNFATSIISILYNQKKVYVLMDAFDEISLNCVNSVISLAKNILQSGYHLWITTRIAESAILENKLNVFSISLNPFTVRDQKLYLTQLLSKRNKNTTETYIEKLQSLLSNSFANWDSGFLGVPLHLQMIVEIFQDKNVEYLNNFGKISVVDLYETFINNKFDVYWRKMFQDNINGLSEEIYNRLWSELKVQHSEASLVLFFPKNMLKQVLNLTEVETFLKKRATGSVGIILSGSDWEQPVFAHRTFAEYLAAQYLASHFQEEKMKPLLIELFKEGLTSIRNVFDRMLAKGHPLHLAVLNKDLDEVNRLIEVNKSDFDLDLGGRTALHLAASQGSRHPFPKMDRPQNAILCEIKVHEHKVNLVDLYVLKILEKVINISGEKHCDNLLGWRAIDYACHTYSLDILEAMFSNDEPDSILKFFGEISLMYYCVEFAYTRILRRISVQDTFIATDVRRNLFHLAVKNVGVLQILLNKLSPRKIRVYLIRTDINGNPPLFYSALNGNIRIFELLLQYKINLNMTNVYGLSLLHILIFYGHFECLQYLVTEKSIDLDVRVNSHNLRDHSFRNPGHTPLYFAVHKNDQKSIALLLQHKADVHLKYEDGRTLLHVASLNEFCAVIQKLLDGGAEIDSVDDNGRTPLHYAAHNMKLNSFNLLFHLGADVNSVDIFGRTPLHYAIQNFRLELIQFSEKQKISVNTRDKCGRTLQHYAAGKIKIEKVLKFLLPFGKDVNEWRHYGTAPVHKASESENLDNIAFLKKLRVDLNQSDDSGRTPLHYAIEQKNFSVFEYFLELGAKINKADNTGRTPLFQEIEKGNTDVVRFILQHSPAVNKWNHFKVAPIHICCERGFSKCVELLIDNGADVNLSTIDGCTPLFIAVKQNNLHLVKLLTTNNANLNKPSYDTFANKKFNCIMGQTDSVKSKEHMVFPLHAAIQLGNMEIIQLLLEESVKINVPDMNGWTALHYAAYEGRTKCVDILVNRGAGLHLQNQDGSTPIHLATKRNHCSTLKTLLKFVRPTAINKFTKDLQTALHIACCNGCLTCAKALVEGGADIGLCTKEGLTLMDLAVNHKHADIQQYIQQL